MAGGDFEEISAEALRDYMAAHPEKGYLIIDVRQPGEYAAGHIPGAKHMPVMQLVANLFELPADRDLIFYCHSGGRSTAAAALAAEEGISQKRIYHLIGGILAYEGKLLSDFPRVQLFAKDQSKAALLHTAMDLEKGALGYYQYTQRRFPGLAITAILGELAQAELAHARMIYGFWKKSVVEPPPFEALFDRLRGDILEGGQPLEEGLRKVAALEGDLCLNLIEMALNIEYRALDLYRNVAEGSSDATARSAFLAIAQVEKEHIRKLLDSIPRCGA